MRTEEVSGGTMFYKEIVPGLEIGMLDLGPEANPLGQGPGKGRYASCLVVSGVPYTGMFGDTPQEALSFLVEGW